MKGLPGQVVSFLRANPTNVHLRADGLCVSCAGIIVESYVNHESQRVLVVKAPRLHVEEVRLRLTKPRKSLLDDCTYRVEIAKVTSAASGEIIPGVTHPL